MNPLNYRTRSRRMNVLIRFSLPALLLLSLTGCWTSSGHEVVVYTALDEEFSKPIFADFTKSTGIVVLPKFDAESTKTVGLANAIAEEADRPRCNVFWNNEILLTVRLGRQGLLDVYRPKIAERLPGHVSLPGRPLARPGGPRQDPARQYEERAEGAVAAVDPRSDRPQVERANRHGQAAVRHHRHARRLPLRGLGRREGPRLLRQALR